MSVYELGCYTYQDSGKRPLLSAGTVIGRGVKTFEECRNAASAESKPYFGLEFYQDNSDGTNTNGQKAQCYIGTFLDSDRDYLKQTTFTEQVAGENGVYPNHPIAPFNTIPSCKRENGKILGSGWAMGLYSTEKTKNEFKDWLSGTTVPSVKPSVVPSVIPSVVPSVVPKKYKLTGGHIAFIVCFAVVMFFLLIWLIFSFFKKPLNPVKPPIAPMKPVLKRLT